MVDHKCRRAEGMPGHVQQLKPRPVKREFVAVTCRLKPDGEMGKAGCIGFVKQQAHVEVARELHCPADVIRVMMRRKEAHDLQPELVEATEDRRRFGGIDDHRLARGLIKDDVRVVVVKTGNYLDNNAHVVLILEGQTPSSSRH